MTGTSLLSVEDARGVRMLTLNRPERRNALDTGLARALLDSLRAADQDGSVGAVVIAAAGPVFCAGADLGEFKDVPAGAQRLAERSDLFLALQLAFEEIGVPTVSAVAGAAVGLGASLAIAADFTVLAESAGLSWPEIMHGMVPSLAMVHLQHRAGRKKAWELLALGVPIPSSEALALGLANRVVDGAAVNATALEMASALAVRKREAIRESKAIFTSIAGLSLPDALRAAREQARSRAGTAGKSA